MTVYLYITNARDAYSSVRGLVEAADSLMVTIWRILQSHG